MTEPQVADYFVSGTEHFDAVLLENGVNLDGSPHYEELTADLLSKLYASKPNVIVYCVTSYPRPSVAAEDSRANPCTVDLDCSYENDRILRRLVAKYPNCRLIEGHEIMDNMTNLTHDLIHMSDYGHIMTATNLAREIRF